MSPKDIIGCCGRTVLQWNRRGSRVAGQGSDMEDRGERMMIRWLYQTPRTHTEWGVWKQSWQGLLIDWMCRTGKWWDSRRIADWQWRTSEAPHQFRAWVVIKVSGGWLTPVPTAPAPHTQPPSLTRRGIAGTWRKPARGIDWFQICLKSRFKIKP